MLISRESIIFTQIREKNYKKLGIALLSDFCLGSVASPTRNSQFPNGQHPRLKPAVAAIALFISRSGGWKENLQCVMRNWKVNNYALRITNYALKIRQFAMADFLISFSSIQISLHQRSVQLFLE